jgi:hypothetical protein
MTDIKLKKLPDKNTPDYFRILVNNCIDTFGHIPNDSICLDYNRVTGKLRAMVLNDERYRQETRNIYAKQRLEELQEIENLAKLATGGDEDNDYDPRDRGKKKKSTSADKDTLNIRFKAAQMRRELITSLNDVAGATERDAINLLFVGLTREEIMQSAKNEINDGNEDEELDELLGTKDEAPEGTGDKLRKKGQDRPSDDEDAFETLPDGGIVER